MTAEDTAEGPIPNWTLLTSYGLVLLYVTQHPDATIREISERLLLTERRVAGVIKELVAVGLLEVRRQGRRNHYALSHEARFRHPILDNVHFSAFVELCKAGQQIASA